MGKRLRHGIYCRPAVISRQPQHLIMPILPKSCQKFPKSSNWKRNIKSTPNCTRKPRRRFGNQCTISLFFRQHEVANEIHQRNKFQIIKTALTNFYRRGGFYMNTYGSPFRQVQTSLCLGFTNLLSVTQTPSLSHNCSPHPIHISSPVPRPGRIPRTCR